MDLKRPDYSPEQQLDIEESERKRKMFTVEEGRNTEYWVVLREKIFSMAKSEEAYLQIFNRSGITGEDVQKYNLSVSRREVLLGMLTLNEEIVAENKLWLEHRARQKAAQKDEQERGKAGTVWGYVKTFVGMNGKEV